MGKSQNAKSVGAGQVDDLDRRFHAACRAISKLCSGREANTEKGLIAIQVALEQLPLTTYEFQIATNRLANVRRYEKSNEAGAAIYEAKLLLGIIKRSRSAFPS